MTDKKIAVVMGSDSDFPTLKPCIKLLKDFGVSVDVRVMSAHRTPHIACQFAQDARKNGYGAIIAAAGKAAHLAGVIAGHTSLPVIGIPIKSSTLDGLDALLATVQMPSGIPVATVAIDGSANAALLALQMLGIYDDDIAKRLDEYKSNMANDVVIKDKNLQCEVEKL